MKTLAAILTQQKCPLLLEELEVPRLGYGQVLVQIKATRICGSQLGEIDGVKGPDKYLPHLLGHEAGGIVLETGPEVTHVKEGDRVVAHWRPGRGINARSTTYKLGSKTVNAGPITTFQELAVLSENRLTVVPSDTDFELAALMADTLTTGFGAVTRDARLQIGESAVVIGVGGIGLGAVLGAHLAGAHPIVAVDLHDHKLELAKQHGATHVCNVSKADLAAQVLEALGGPADVVFDLTGRPEVIEAAWRFTSPQGCLTLLGVMPEGLHARLHTLPLHFGKRIVGSEGGSSQPSTDIPKYLRMLTAGRFHVSNFVSHRCGLQEINGAIARMRSGESVHSMIHFDSQQTETPSEKGCL